MINFQKIKKGFEDIKLKNDSKERIKSELYSFMQKNPVMGSLNTRHIKWNEKRSLNIRRILLNPMPIVLIIALLLGGGTTFAAEQSLPGDVLYPVKVSVNEGVRGWFAVSDGAEARLNARLAERRLEEAEELASDDRLDDSTRSEVESRFRMHAEKIKEAVNNLDDDPDKRSEVFGISSDFEASLRAHEGIIFTLSNQKKGIGNDLTSILAAIRSETGAIQIINEDMEDRVVSIGSIVSDEKMKDVAERKMKEAREKIAEVKKYIERKYGANDTVEREDVENKLKIAEDLFGDGVSYFDSGEYNMALVAFQKASNTAHRILIILMGEKKYQISVNSIGAVSSIGPAPIVVNTGTESSMRLEAEKKYKESVDKLAETKKFYESRMSITTAETEKRFYEKYNLAEEYIVKGKRYIEAKAYERAIKVFSEAIVLLDEAYRIASGEKVYETDPVNLQGIVPVGSGPSGEENSETGSNSGGFGEGKQGN